MKYIDMLVMAAMVHVVGYIFSEVREWRARRYIDKMMDEMSSLDAKVREIKMRRVK